MLPNNLKFYSLFSGVLEKVSQLGIYDLRGLQINSSQRTAPTKINECSQ